MDDLIKGQILDRRFSLIELRGKGGMGQVWAANDGELEEKVALKILHKQLAGNSHLVDLLKNECRNTRKLIHPHIVRIFDFHRSDNLVYISMEYIDGQNLDEYRREQGVLSYDEVILLLLPIIDALSYAHSLGLVHRDVKAANVLIDNQGSVRLADFGIASVLHSELKGFTITTGGSLFCMSPQQLRGEFCHPSDDIYSLGVLMYDLLTGHPPFYPSITEDKIYYEIPPSVNEQRQSSGVDILVPQSLNDLIQTMLTKTPEERPPSLLEVRETLDEIRDDTFYQSPPLSPATTSFEQPYFKQGENLESSVIPEYSSPGTFLSPRQSQSRKKHFIFIAFFILALAVTIFSGVILIDYLKKNPFKTVTLPQNTVNDESEKEKTHDKELEFSAKKERKKTQVPASGGTSEKKLDSSPEDDTDVISAPKEPVKTERIIKTPVPDLEAVPEKTDAVFAGKKPEKEPAVIPEYKEVVKPVKPIDPTQDFISSGKRNERRGKLVLARADYEKALEISPQSYQAQTGLKRVKDLLTEKEFKALLSSGLAAYRKKDFESARRDILKARDLRPDSSEAKEALSKVQGAIRNMHIDELRNKARIQEQDEDWKQAFESYQELLKIDSSLDFAVKGKERSNTLMKLSQNINHYIAKPSLLQSDRHLNNAAALVKEAQKVGIRGRKLPQDIEKLEKLVKTARIKITVTFESDNETQVAVYRVGRLGNFDTRRLELHPGTYTVVGTRNGYKDVRQKITIRAGQIPPVIIVKCQEKI